jgi:hypothetical protein
MTKQKEVKLQELEVKTSESAQRLLAKVLGEIQETERQRRLLANTLAALQNKLNNMLAMYMEGQGYSLDKYNIVEYDDHGRGFKIVERDE